MNTFTNNLKTVFLLGALFALLVWAGYALGGAQGLVIAGIFALLMNVGAWFYSDKIAIAAMRGREVDERSAGNLYTLVQRLAQRANLPMPRVYICPHEAPNAFATGRNPKHAAVAVTDGALRLLNDHELEGVIGHELSHIRNRDTLTSMIAATVAGIFSMLAYSFMFFGGGNRQGGNPLAVLGVVILGGVGAALIKAMLSRTREFVADAEGAEIAGTPNGLVSALQKLDAYAKRIPLLQPNPAMNNMFIIEPLSGGRALTNLFASHPPTEKRIAALLGRR